MNINELIENKADVKEQIKVLETEVKKLKEKDEEIDRQLFSEMDTHGLSRTANDNYSASINSDTVPQVNNWDLFYAYLLESEELSLQQRRLSSKACKEKWEAGETIPGVEPREIRRINFRKL